MNAADRPPAAHPAAPPSVTIGGAAVALRVLQQPRARRISVRLDLREDRVILVMPRGVGLRRGLAFLARQQAWLERRRAQLAPRVRFVDGAIIPLRGQPHRIRRCPWAAAGVVCAEAEIRVGGAAGSLAAQLTDWLVATAHREFVRHALSFAARVDRPIARVAIRDGRSRWGSCSRAGRLSFSWRLLLAPPAVAEYVVAHEVAHLVHMNHGRRFHALVNRLAPTAAGEGDRWLRRHGADLHRYG